MKNYVKSAWNNKKKRYIIIGIISIVILLLLIIIIAVAVSKRTKSNAVCKKPYKIKLYSEKEIKSKLKECGYKQDTELFNFLLGSIKRHNLYRQCHNAQPLMPNCEIMEISQGYAETMPSGHSGYDFKGNYLGENLYWITNGYPTAEDPVDAWYNEIVDYDFKAQKSKNGYKVGHLTQLIWKDSAEIGIGFYCLDNKCCVSANYYPGGNVIGNYENQVQDLQ